MEERPRLKIELTLIDKIVEIISWILLGMLWIFMILNYSALPETIPVHFDGVGKPDSYGGKQMSLLLPFVTTILFACLSLLNKYYYKFNYPTKITIENAKKQYTMASRLIRFLKLFIVLVFLWITYSSIQTSIGKSDGLGSWFLPLSLFLLLIPLLTFIIQALRIKK